MESRAISLDIGEPKIPRGPLPTPLNMSMTILSHGTAVLCPIPRPPERRMKKRGRPRKYEQHKMTEQAVISPVEVTRSKDDRIVAPSAKAAILEVTEPKVHISSGVQEPITTSFARPFDLNIPLKPDGTPYKRFEYFEQSGNSNDA